MDDEKFRDGLLRKLDKVAELLERSQQKPRLSKTAAVLVGLVGLVATGFAVQQGYTAYRRYAVERRFASHYKSVADEFLRGGDYKRALEALREADKLNPYDAEIYYGRAKAFAFLKALQKDDQELAEVQCKLVIREDPKNAEAYKFLGIIYANEGDYTEAETAFKKAIELKGGHYEDVTYDLGKLYAEHAKTLSKLPQHDLDERVALLKHAISVNEEIAKNELRAAYNIACDHALLGEKDYAIDALRSVLGNGYDRYHQIAADSDLDDIREDSRFSQLIQGRYTEVVVKYQGLVESGHTTPEILHTLAWIQLYSSDSEKLREGFDYANRALLAEPQNATFLATLAQLYAKDDKYTLALEKIKLAMDRDPSRSYYSRLQKAWQKKNQDEIKPRNSMPQCRPSDSKTTASEPNITALQTVRKAAKAWSLL